MLRVINPATEEVVREVPEHTAEEVERRLERAAEAFAVWRRTSFPERATRMRRAAALLRERKTAHARLMTEEMGKPIAASEAEVEKCAWVCDFFAERAVEFLAPERVPTDARESWVRFDPLGPVLAIMPWNFPFWQVFRFAAPALMAGNVGLLKHASNVPGSALAIEEVFRDAGFPEGGFSSLLVGSETVPGLIQDRRVRAVTLTGSDAAGRKVAEAAGKALKKTVLELGGSDPFVVLADADVASVARQAAKARAINSGQSCIAAKRFIVEAPVSEHFERAFVEAIASLRVGDPMDPATEVGPLAREDLRESLHSQVERSLAAGARLLTGGRRLERRGYFYAPTVLGGVEPGMPAFDEETFGPVAAIISAKDEEEAIRLANDSPFGLGAAVFTGDPERGERIATERLEAGCCFVNDFVKSDPRLPFGGVKMSGYGRELSAFGIKEFVNIKTVYVR